jgi:hypothetical protein
MGTIGKGGEVIDQFAVISRVADRLVVEGRKVTEMTADEIDAYIDEAFRELVAEGPKFPIFDP